MSAPSRPTPRSPLPPPPGLPAAGDVLVDKYVVERVLGVGGMGAVLLARHTELDERVAIKMLLPSATPLPPSSEAVTRFIREARAAIKIRNEHVVRILDVGRMPDGAPFIVMEYLEGSDLARLVEARGPLPVQDAVEYVVQACEAIAAAHALGIIHRDLKPANLFLTRTGDGRPCIKVLDFGISKIADGGAGGPGGGNLTSTATVMGTPCFMSPEQLRSTRDVDVRTDVWSLGAILHALLAGSPPYDGESNADVSAKIIRDMPTPIRSLRPEVGAELEAIVLRCLEKEREARFPDVSELARALAAVTPSEAVQASAQRVVRGAMAAAPTLASTPPLAMAASGPTRTASAWGDTGHHDAKAAPGRRPRRMAGVIAAFAVVAALATFGIVRLTQPSPATSTSAASPPVPAPTLVPAAPATTDVMVASTTPLAASVPLPPTAASAPPARGTTGPTSRQGRPASASPTASSAATAAAAVPPAPAPTKPAAGLFDGRE